MFCDDKTFPVSIYYLQQKYGLYFNYFHSFNKNAALFLSLLQLMCPRTQSNDIFLLLSMENTAVIAQQPVWLHHWGKDLIKVTNTNKRMEVKSQNRKVIVKKQHLPLDISNIRTLSIQALKRVVSSTPKFGQQCLSGGFDYSRHCSSPHRSSVYQNYILSCFCFYFYSSFV